MKRNGYRMDSGGPDSKLYKSTDSGNTWTDITNNNGLPSGPWGIAGITVSPVDSNRVWAIIEAEDGGLFRSDDAGKTWKKINQNRALRQRAWYYSRIYADTQDKNKVYVMNVSYGVSADGGKTFTLKNAPHGDHHDLWIDPDNNQRMIIADDGGAQVSNDGGTNWTTYHNQPTAQFYRVTTDNNFPYRIYGAQQDNSTVRISHRSSGSSIGEKDWETTAGGESAHLAVDPKNNDIVYGGTYKGYMMRNDHSLDQTRSTNVWPDNPAGSGAEIMKYRFNWNYPVMFSIHDKNRLYAGSNFLHTSTNEGQSWEVISPDLTRGLPETIKSSGGPITQDNTGAEFYSNIFAIAESSLEKGVIYVGSDDGLVHISKDDGKTWKNITPPSNISPKLNMINCIEPSPFKEGVAYLAATSYKFGDYTPYLYKTINYGESWTLITNGIKNNHYTRAIRSDKVREGLLYAGTEWGMYVSFDDGQHWSSFQLNLPMTSIRDLAVRDNDLIAATSGRGFWVLDDLSALQQSHGDPDTTSVKLYAPKTTYKYTLGGGYEKGGNVGQNPWPGVTIDYYLPHDFKDTSLLELEILDAQGNLIRTYTNQKPGDFKSWTGGPPPPKVIPSVPGLNRTNWDLGRETLPSVEGVFILGSLAGSTVGPGSYTLQVSMGDQISSQEVQLLADPRLDASPEDFQLQAEMLVNIETAIREIHQSVTRMRTVKTQVNSKLELLSDFEDAESVQESGNAVLEAIETWENKLIQPKQKTFQDVINFENRLNAELNMLRSRIDSYDPRQTDGARKRSEELLEEWETLKVEMKEVVEEEIAIFNARYRQLELPALIVPATE